MRLLALASFIFSCCSLANSQSLDLIRKIPHSGWSEGLDFHDGYLWNAFPKEILKIDPKDGEVVGRFAPATEYSESLKWVGNTLWNLSFSDNGIYQGSLKAGKFSYTRKGSVPEVHAWGLEYDGKNFIVTGNYSPIIYFMDRKTFNVSRTITLEVSDLEDLAWDGESLWTSSFQSHPGEIFRVDTKAGQIEAFYALPNGAECPVVDGIAIESGTLWVTGKNCPGIYQYKLPPRRAISSAKDLKKK